MSKRCVVCPRIIRSGSRCPEHTATRQERGYDEDWQRIRPVILERDGHVCQIRLPGCTGRATTVDHVIPLSAGGARLDPDNLRGACSPCNSAKGGRVMG